MIARRYAVAVVGSASGRMVELRFLRFWRRVSAVRWVVAHNQAAGDPLTYFAVIDRRLGTPTVAPTAVPPTVAENEATQRAFEQLRDDIRRRQPDQ